MKGQEINTVCKVLSAFDQEYVPMSETLRVVNKDHVMMCSIERTDVRNAIFHFTDDRCVNVKDIKLNPKEEYSICETDNSLVFQSNDSEYCYKRVYSPFENVNDIRFNLSLIINDVPIKELLTAIKEGKKNVDWVKLKYDSEYRELLVTNERDGVKFAKRIPCTCDGKEDYCSCFAVKYLIKVLSCVPAKTKLVLALDNDSPIKIAWNTTEYRYGVAIAPRIEH